MLHAYNKIRRGILALTALAAVTASPSFAQWSELPSLGQVRNLPMTAVAEGKLYVWGGSAVDMGLTDFLPNGASFNTGVMTSLTGGASWTSLLPMPEPRNGGYATWIGGKFYILGGNKIANNQLGITGSVIEFDPATQTYTTRDAMQTPVFGAAYATVGSKIYVIGGLSVAGQQVQFHNQVQVYDVNAGAWSTLATTAPYALGYGTATAIGQKILLVGGASVQNQSLVYTANAYMGTPGPTGDITWTAVANYPVPMALAASGTLNGKAYVAGGEGATGVMNSVYRFDETGNKWDLSYALPTPIANVHSMPNDGSSLYLVGGRGSKKVFKFQEGTPAPIASIAQTNFYVTATPNSAAQNIAIRLTNSGVVALNGTINIPAEAQSWLSTTNGTFSNIMPGATSNLAISVGGPSVAAGDYKATVLVTTNDPNHAQTPVTINLYVREGLISQDTRIVVEESSGSWCGPCGAYGIPLLRDLQEQYGEKMILIANHDRGGAYQDPMYTVESEEIGARLGVSFFPSASFHRWLFAGEKAPLIGTGTWESAMATISALQPKAPIALELKEYTYTSIGNEVAAKLKLTTTQAIPWNSNLSLRVTAVVTEDSLKYSQNGSTENPFYHMHATRDYWPNTLGQQITIPAAALDASGGAILPGQSFDVDIKFSPENLTAPKRSHIVFIAHVNQDNALGPVLQGMEHSLTASLNAGATYTFDAGTTSKNVGTNEKGIFEATVRNTGTSPMQLTATRVSTDYPSNWSSWICVGDDCAAPTDQSKSTTVMPGESKVFRVHMQSGSNGTGKVTLRVSDGNGNDNTQEYVLNVSGGSGVPVVAVAGNGLRLMQNVPNPATTTTSLGYVIPSAGTVTVELFSVNGEKVLSMDKGSVEAGEHRVDLDVSSLPNGIYTVRLTSNGTSVARTISVTR